MVNQQNESKEFGSRGASVQAPRLDSQEAQTLNLNTEARDILQTVDGAEEGAESGIGHVRETSEGIGEHRQATAGKFKDFQHNLSKAEIAALKQKLLATPPSRRQMVHEIRSHVDREIGQLEVQAKRCRKKGAFYELNQVVTRLRELTYLLEELLYATAEMIKNIWLKIVHGIAQ